MTLRENIIEIISEALTADETVLPNEILDANNHIIFAASELASRATDLFVEEDGDYAEQVKAFLEGLPPELPLVSIFPKAVNLPAFLDLASLVDLDDLDEPAPAGINQLNISEVTDLDAYARDGQPVQLYVYERPNHLAESFVFIDLTQGNPVTTQTVPKMMTACATLMVGQHPGDMIGRRWIISSMNNEVRRQSYVKYHLLLNGYRLTNAIMAPNSNALAGIAETLTTANEYSQFAEPFEILGEINGRTTVLDTILSSYHVLENYMIRAQIAKVANDNLGAFFGIRHFKQMELAVEKKEMEHLTQLFRVSWDIDIGGQTLAGFVDTKFAGLFQRADFVEQPFQEFMRRLTVKKRNEVLNTNNAGDLRAALPKIIYQVRCSIVHNKETEFHLSNKELLNPVVLMTLTDLCLPCMQRLAFGLPAAPAPNPLRYDRPVLQLY
ncbi:hypothetical protein [Rhizobium ruizarguesonis]|uniref:hypothetical protein n=1 Tax=Rhizobium ruizarguesonis TaxID=2081791 RepID=UPI001445639A|nr:hypothetical protein [Rhizobium ruizarguesonis]NKQ83453.1 hypothetical protein [Rhizobium ruizarguesonis]